MEITDVRVQRIQGELDRLNKLLSLLKLEIQSQKAKDVLLCSASNSLNGVETTLLPYALNSLNPTAESMWLCHTQARYLHTPTLSHQEPVWAARSRTTAANKMSSRKERLPSGPRRCRRGRRVPGVKF